MKSEKAIIVKATISFEGRNYLTVAEYCKKYRIKKPTLWYHLGKNVPKIHLAGTKTVIIPDEPISRPITANL